MPRVPTLCLIPALLCGAPAGAAMPDAALPFSAAERARVLSLGPWPPAFRPDPSNRVSGQPLAIELGRRLFNDPRMSPVGYIACVTCHQTDRAFTDNKARAHGLGDLPRNTPTLANLRQQRWYGWGGASDSLWMASLQPMLDAREFDSKPQIVARIYQRDAELAQCYRAVFKSASAGDAERVMVNTGKVLAAFQETLRTERTPFDEFRDALARKDRGAMARYPLAAQRGLKLFVGTLGCVDCHAGPNFSDGAFHQGAPTEVKHPRSAFGAPPQGGAASSPAEPVPRRPLGGAGSWVVGGASAPWGTEISGDLGRHDDVRKLQTSAFNLLGKHTDAGQDAKPRVHAQASDGDRGAFRTPSLRNVSVTAPYLHDGSVDALRDAMTHRLTQAALGEAQRDDLRAFLLTLTDRHGERRPPSVAPARCP